MTTPPSPTYVEGWLSTERFRSYLAAAGGDRNQAVMLYQWNATMASACFEALHYVEVLLRNAIDRVMREYLDEDVKGIPWFLLPVLEKGQATFEDNIERVRKRLRAQSATKETRGQILAGMDFGFWTALFHGQHEDLWRSALRKALPASSGKRKDVVTALEQLRVFRNRLAHHDSLLAVDVLFRLSQMRDVIRWIDPAAEGWFIATERITSTYALRPVAARDTVVVAGRDAWPLYQSDHAYVCQAGRSFQPVDYIAFYADREIKPEVARVLRRVDNVDWSVAEANRLAASSSAADQRLASIITASRAAGWTEGRYQVFDLTKPGDSGHLSLSAAVPHNETGKGSAFTQRQRYTSRDRLRGAVSTTDLV